jgi:hypothetical protein
MHEFVEPFRLAGSCASIRRILLLSGPNQCLRGAYCNIQLLPSEGSGVDL